MPLRTPSDPIWIFLSAFAIASFGGIASKLRSKSELSFRALFGAFLYSGICGLIVALAWYNYFDGKGNIPFLLAISGLAGIGGANVLDMIKLFLGGKLNITVEPKLGDTRGQGDDDEH
jgi:hypothetical protein